MANEDLDARYYAECPLCCYGYSCSDEDKAERKVEDHMREQHPEATRSSKIKVMVV